MAAVATREESVARRPQAGRRPSRLFEPRTVSLEDSILTVWRDLVEHGRAECPVCGDSMSPASDGGCPRCGSELFFEVEEGPAQPSNQAGAAPRSAETR
jgi:tRNA(Ile2) C34 agmatinyltransferase TiaS